MRIFSLLLVVLLTASLAGCDDGKSKKNHDAGVPDADVPDVPDADTDTPDVVEDVVDVVDVIDGGSGGCEDFECPATCVVYVDGAATGSGTGQTPAEAFTRVDWALERASLLAGECCRCEVRVAQGTYHVYRQFPTDTLRMRPRVDVSGSWPAGFTGPADPKATPSILSGEMRFYPELRVHHVVTGASDTRLSGFIIERGEALEDDQPGNPHNYGAGLLNLGVEMTVTDCTFRNNEARHGAGMYNRGSSITCHRCRFEDNLADEDGGGIHNSRSRLVLSSSHVLGNRAARGGGLANYDGGEGELVSVMFAANQGASSGGAIANRDGSLSLINVTLGHNWAGTGGGLHHAGASALTVHNSVLWGNSPDQVANLSGVTALITHSDVAGGCTVASGCTTDETGNLDVDPSFWAPSYRDLRLWFTSPLLDQGNNSLMPSEFTQDVDGRARVVDGDGDATATIDIGAHEGRDENGAEGFLPIIYVDMRATGAGNGTSWRDAYPELWMAFRQGRSAIVHVARGVYLPDSFGVRTVAFVPDRGFIVRGGFAPDLGVVDVSTREPALYESILSADLLRNDSTGSYTDNSELLLYSSGNLLLDGLVFQDARNKTIQVNGGDFTLRNSVIRDNLADYSGFVFSASSARVVIEDCTFEGNTLTNNWGLLTLHDSARANRITGGRITGNSSQGSGLLIHNSAVDISGTEFSSNYSTNSGSSSWIGGGAVMIHSGGARRTSIRDCTFTDNRANVGGAVSVYNSSQVFLENNVFDGNAAYASNVAGWSAGQCGSILTDFGGSGGAVAIRDSTVDLRGCTFTGNSASTGQVSVCGNSQRIFIGNGGAVFADNSHVNIHDSTFTSNIATGGRCYGGSGGGLAAFNYSKIHISNSFFLNNHARRLGADNPIDNWCQMARGGAIFLHHRAIPSSLAVSHGSTPETAAWIANTVIWGNTSTPNTDPNNGHWYGAGGVHLAGSASGKLWMVNTTVTNNRGGNGFYGGAGVLYELSQLMLNNSIVHSNVARSSGFGYRDISGNGGVCDSNSSLYLHESNVGSPASCPSGCVCTGWYAGSPAFVDAVSDPPDLRLQDASVCRNAGLPGNRIADTNDIDGDGDLAEMIPWDLDGQSRSLGPNIDCGAYERD